MDKPQTLNFYLDYALANYKEASTKTLADAKADYIQQRTEDWKKGLITEVSLTNIRCSLKKFVTMFPNILLADVDVEKIVQYCESNNAAQKTHNNRRDDVSAFLKFALEKEWISKNPIDKVPRYQIASKKGSAAALTTQQAQDLMEYVEAFVLWTPSDATALG